MPGKSPPAEQGPWFTRLGQWIKGRGKASPPSEAHSLASSIVKVEGMESLHQLQEDAKRLQDSVRALQIPLQRIQDEIGELRGLSAQTSSLQASVERLGETTHGLTDEIQALHRAFDTAQRKHLEDLGRLEEGIRSFSHTVMWTMLALGLVAVLALASTFFRAS